MTEKALFSQNTRHFILCNQSSTVWLKKRQMSHSSQDCVPFSSLLLERWIFVSKLGVKWGDRDREMFICSCSYGEDLSLWSQSWFSHKWLHTRSSDLALIESDTAAAEGGYACVRVWISIWKLRVNYWSLRKTPVTFSRLSALWWRNGGCPFASWSSSTLRQIRQPVWRM